MKHNSIKIFTVTAAILLMVSCKKFLEYEPKGTLTEDALNTPQRVDALVTAAYAAIGNDVFTGPITSMWIYGSMRSDDAYKGGGAVGDLGEYNAYEQYNLTVPTNSNSANGFPNTWRTAYAAISRANFALRKLNELTDAQMPNRKVRQGEVRFLRGHLHFLLKILFKYVPYIDETLTDEGILAVSNRQFKNDELWNKISEDFQFVITNLPASVPEVGRANQLNGKAYLAKLRLYQAYEQDDNHGVIAVNPTRLNEVLTLTNDVINANKYRLNDDFAKNFLYGFDNGPESIFAIQYSINDGTTIGRISLSTGLSYSLAPQYGCCWFHIPSQNMVNAFKTDANGLPMFDTFNDVALTDADLVTNGAAVDPRIDHTAGIQGHPFKYQPTILYNHSWERISALYGGFGNMKEQQAADCPCFKKQGPFYGSSVNLDVIRYADVLLWRAEALIELNRHAEALPLINQLRSRAKNSTGRTKFANGTNPSNYQINEYVPGVNIDWTQSNARKALQWERRLEFAMESPRFFDLVRWGIAAETLNAYLAKEKPRKPYLASAVFTKGREEYFPIPQTEIDYTKGVYVQNNKY
ncbi:MAG: RagB/SusD family nutrient uptake outer membrane protein [Chitinophagaceae bacterium]